MRAPPIDVYGNHFDARRLGPKPLIFRLLMITLPQRPLPICHLELEIIGNQWRHAGGIIGRLGVPSRRSSTRSSPRC